MNRQMLFHATPIPHDLLVNIAEEFSKCGLVYASTLPSAQCGDGK